MKNLNRITRSAISTVFALQMACSGGGGSGSAGEAPKSWRSPENIESFTEDVSSKVYTAIGANGHMAAIFRQTEASNHSIYAKMFIPGSGWTDTQSVESLSDMATSPRIAVDGSGNAIATWQQHNGTTYDLYGARYTSGSGWGSPQLLESATLYAGDPEIAMDASGNATVVFVVASVSSGYDVYANRYTVGSGWLSSAVLIESYSGEASDPVVAADASGNVTAAWKAYDGTRYNARSSRYFAGSGWGADAQIESVNLPIDTMGVVAVNGTAMVSFLVNSGGLNYDYMAVHYDGSAWETESYVESASGRVFEPTMSAYGSGTYVALFAQRDGSIDRLSANIYTPGAGWGTASVIDHSTTASSREPAIACNASGTCFGLYSEYSTPAKMYMVKYVAGTGFEAAARHDEYLGATGGTYSPTVAINSSGKAITSWLQTDTSSIEDAIVRLYY